MSKFKIGLITMFFTVMFLTTAAAKEFINIEAEGNLESKFQIGCVSLDKLTNEHTPADIYRGLARCIEEENFENAKRLFFLAGTYGRFDMLRVTDRTAHQAIRALQIINLRDIDAEKSKKFKEKLKSEMTQNKAEKKKICTEIKKFGYPKYYPTYMIQHGINALNSNNTNPVVDNFDESNAWTKSLSGYMRCDFAPEDEDW